MAFQPCISGAFKAQRIVARADRGIDMSAAGCQKQESGSQIGPLRRPSRTAAARQIAANAEPIHRPGLIRNFPGASSDSGDIVMPPVVNGPLSDPPPIRYLSRFAK